MPQEPGRRRLPFLHRNWTVGVAAHQEWTPKRRLPANFSTTLPPSSKGVDEDPYLHPSKRQRLGPPPPGVGVIEDVVKLPQRPGNRSNGLRIQVFNVFHQDTPRLRFASDLSAKESSSDVTRYNARFKVTILSERYGKPVLMYCAAQIGAVQAVRASSSGRYGLARLVLEPFTVPLEEIAVLHRDGDMFGLADKYMLRVEIESTASNEPWPPLDLLSLADTSRRGSDYRPKKASDCVLCAESSDFFGRPRMRIPLWVRESMQHDAVRTDFVMDMDVRWTTGFLERPRRHLGSGVLPTIVALHPDEPLPPPPTLDLCDLWPRRHSYRPQLLAAAAKKKAASAATSAGAVLGDITSGHTNMYVPGAINGTANSSSAAKGATTYGGVERVERVAAAGSVVTNSVFTNGSSTPSDPTGQLQNQINSQLSREINDQVNVNGHALGANTTVGLAAVVNDDNATEIVDWLDSPNAPSRASRSSTKLDCPTTPSRPRRTRHDQPEYNVRRMTNRAHSMQSRNGRSRGSKTFSNINGHIKGHINGNGSGYGVVNSHIKVIYYYQYEHVTIDGFQCCMCMATNPDLDHLRLHLRSHLHYAFHYEPRSARATDHVFRITHVADTSGVRLQDRVFQLGRPTKALDIERFLQGDESWLTSRFGPLNDDKVVKLAHPPRPKAKPVSVAAAKQATPTPALSKSKSKKKVLVPATRQPLYDPLSKALLKPGTVLRTNIVDDSWRIHKHREIVQDYSDLTNAEKEFIQEWDRFIILKRIASDAYIPRAMVQFIKEKGLWLVSDLNRAMEFGKLMAVMVAHDILTDANVDEVTNAMDAAWALKRSIDPNDSQAIEAANSTSAPKAYALRRGTGGCPICGYRFAVADSVICCNRACKQRQYHTACLRNIALVRLEERGEWYCNNCVHLADPAHLVQKPARGQPASLD